MADAKNGYAIEYVKGDFENAQYLPDPHVDNVQAALMRLGGEVWAIHRRQLIIEALFDKNKPVNSAAIEAYVPTAAEQVKWDQERDRFIDRTLSILTRVPEQTKGPNPLRKVPPLGPKA
jgi:hypothetical protein